MRLTSASPRSISGSALANDLRLLFASIALSINVVVSVVVVWLVRCCFRCARYCCAVVFLLFLLLLLLLVIGHRNGITSSLGEWAKTPLPSSFTKLAVPGVGWRPSWENRQETSRRLERQITSLKRQFQFLNYTQTVNHWCGSVRVGFLHSLVCPPLFGTSVSWGYLFIDDFLCYIM